MKIGNYNSVVHVRFTDEEYAALGQPSHMGVRTDKLHPRHIIGLIPSKSEQDYKIAHKPQNKEAPYSFAFTTSRLPKSTPKFGVEETNFVAKDGEFLVIKTAMTTPIVPYYGRRSRRRRPFGAIDTPAAVPATVGVDFVEFSNAIEIVNKVRRACPGLKMAFEQDGMLRASFAA